MTSPQSINFNSVQREDFLEKKLYKELLPILFIPDEKGHKLLWGKLDYNDFASESFYSRAVGKYHADYRSGLVEPPIETPLSIVHEVAKRIKSVEPSGFIFHVSHCGSTLLCKMLGAMDDNLALSEPRPLDSLLRYVGNMDSPTSESVQLFRDLVKVYGQIRSDNKKQFFIKFNSWDLLYSKLVRKAYPDTPWVCVYRHPSEVLMGRLRRNYASNRVWLERGGYKKLTKMEQLKIGTMEAMLQNLDSYYKHISEEILPFSNNLVVDYADFGEPLYRSVISHFGISATLDDTEKMLAVTKFHSKSQQGENVEFSADSDKRRAEVTSEAQEYINKSLMPSYLNIRENKIEYRQEIVDDSLSINFLWDSKCSSYRYSSPSFDDLSVLDLEGCIPTGIERVGNKTYIVFTDAKSLASRDDLDFQACSREIYSYKHERLLAIEKIDEMEGDKFFNPSAVLFYTDASSMEQFHSVCNENNVQLINGLNIIGLMYDLINSYAREYVVLATAALIEKYLKNVLTKDKYIVAFSEDDLLFVDFIKIFFKTCPYIYDVVSPRQYLREKIFGGLVEKNKKLCNEKFFDISQEQRIHIGYLEAEILFFRNCLEIINANLLGNENEMAFYFSSLSEENISDLFGLLDLNVVCLPGNSLSLCREVKGDKDLDEELNFYIEELIDKYCRDLYEPIAENLDRRVLESYESGEI